MGAKEEISDALNQLYFFYGFFFLLLLSLCEELCFSPFLFVKFNFSTDLKILFLDFKSFNMQALMPRVPHKLLESLWEEVLEQPNDEISKLLTEPSLVLFDAGMSGNVEFLVVLLLGPAQFIWGPRRNFGVGPYFFLIFKY